MENKTNKTNRANKIFKRQRIVVAMSGGVDSSVSAALLKERGYDVVGVFMKVWDPGSLVAGSLVTSRLDNQMTSPLVSRLLVTSKLADQTTRKLVNQCPWIEDQFEARRAAEHLGIPFYTINLEKEYKEAVVDYFFREYAAGRTPNPDVLCNSEIKFGVFLKRMLEMGADYVATGHYARLNRSLAISSSEPTLSPPSGGSGFTISPSLPPDDTVGRTMPARAAIVSSLRTNLAQNPIHPHLFRGIDPKKDQTYFLWKLRPDQLRRVIFPVGGYTKPEVRDLAKKFGLPNANRKDSQGICFIGPVNIQDFLKTQLPVKKGKVVTTNGQEVGEHEGVWFYTIGQRHRWKPTKNFMLGKSGSESILIASSDAVGSARSTDLSRLKLGTMPDQSARASSPRQNLAYHNDRPPLYVVDKDLKNNILIVGPNDDPKLWAKGMVVGQLNWLTDYRLPNEVVDCGRLVVDNLRCQIRYQQKPIEVKRVKRVKRESSQVEFSEPVRAVTPGQSAVFYNGEIVLGGGIIEKAI
jgi:tRNA-specific 2-thiouridylase